MPIAPQTPSSPNQQPVLLESDVPLSQSVIWRLQREFYIQRGLRAWTEDMVPNFITNNPFIAEIYARIVFAFLCDCTAPRISPENPLRILELGAGVGKFSYLFLRHLMPLLRAKGIAPDAVRYCMTDCSESTIQAWRSNSYLADLVKAGVLEFELLQVGEEIKSQFLSRKGPLVLIASYVFDSLPQDAFVVQEGTILEALVTTAAPVAAGGESRSSLNCSFLIRTSACRRIATPNNPGTRYLRDTEAVSLRPRYCFRLQLLRPCRSSAGSMMAGCFCWLPIKAMPMKTPWPSPKGHRRLSSTPQTVFPRW